MEGNTKEVCLRRDRPTCLRIIMSNIKLENLEQFVRSLAKSVEDLTIEVQLLKKDVEKLKGSS